MATKNIVPRATGEGNVGTTLKHWLKGWFDSLFVGGSLTDGTASAVIADLASAVSLKHTNTNDPTANQKAALAGTGTPGAGDVYVNNSDARMTNARTPTAHTHVEVDTTSLVADLAGKAAVTHGSNHISTGTDPVPAVVAAGASGLMTGADKTKLDGIAAGAVADHVNIANKGINTHSAIDTFIASKAAASGLASLDANSNLVQNPTLAHGGVIYAALSNGTLALAFGTNSCVKVTPTATGSFTSTVPAAGVECTLIILTSGTTSYTMTFGTGFKSTGTLATGTTSGKVFVVKFISDGTTLNEVSRTVAM